MEFIIGSLIIPIYYFLYKVEHRLTRVETLLNFQVKNVKKGGKNQCKTYNIKN